MTISGSLCKNVLSGLFKSGLYIQLHTVHNFGVPCSVSEMQRVLKTAAWPNQTRRQSFTHIELVALNSEASGFSSGQEARNSLLPEAITCVILKFSWVSICRVWIFFFLFYCLIEEQFDVVCCVSFGSTAKGFSYTYICIFALILFSIIGDYAVLIMVPCVMP